VTNDRTAAGKLRAYAAIENKQAHHARETADALFDPKYQTAVVEDQNGRSDATAPTKQPPARVPRILAAAQPQPDSASEPEQVSTRPPHAHNQQIAEIARSEYGRIHALATHGMTIKQVAEMYGVAESEIAQIVRKLGRAQRTRKSRKTPPAAPTPEGRADE
jgi:hypothetical protein